MFRAPLMSALFVGILVAGAPGQDLTLDDKDLERFEGEPVEAAPPDEAGEADQGARETLGEATARYDQLIDRLKGQLRQVRIELRELPREADRARERLKSMRAAEDDLRRRAFERVVYRWPHPIYEDFETALEEALERQTIRQDLVEKIETNERAVAELEGERAELQNDLEQALELKEQARQAAIEDRHAGQEN